MMKHEQDRKHGVSRMAGVVLAGLMSVAANGATGAEKGAAAESPKNEEMKMKNQWVQDHLTDAKAKLPFSFVYDGKASEGLLIEWPKKIETKKLDASRTQRTMAWTDPKTGLEVRCVSVDYADYPAIEWTMYFKNTGTNNTLILESIQGLDARFERDDGGEFVLNGIKGDFDSKDSYQPYVLTLGPNTTRRFAPAGGRSSDGEFPYYNLQMPGGGVLLAIGWPGQWAASFTRDAANGLRIVAGQELTRLVLKPGEEIRSPLIAMLFWQGDDTVTAQNLWRRWYVAHTLPRRANGETQPAITFFTGYGYESDIAMFQTAIDAGIRADAFWRDAGASSGERTWYPSGGSWGNLGTWEVDRTVYPKGFKPLTDWLKVYDMEFILWFEPERVGGNSWLSKNHPEWVLRGLLNLGNPAARAWLVEQLDKIIVEQGVDIYRQDFNMNPLGNWRGNDAPDRQGVTENLHVQGYLAFWDELLRRHPGMLIDSCASGGRRNDLETMRRAVPLLRSDLIEPSKPGVVEGNQGHTYALSSWLPFQGAPAYSPDPYVCRSYYLPCFGALEAFTPANMAGWRKAFDECRQVAPMVLEGDYYPLTPYSLALDQWIAWQFNRPEQTDGVVQAFRRAGASVAEMRFKLRGLEPDVVYELTDFDKTGKVKMSGRELMDPGLLVKLPPKGSAVIAYTHLSAVATTDVTLGEAPLTVRFDGTSSASASGKIVSYDWTFGDGASARGAVVTHTYEKAGTYTASLTVKNEQGRSVVGEVTVSVTPVDTVAPTLVAIKPPVKTDSLILTFSKPVQKADAERTSNYAITPGVQVLAASLGADLCTVTLATSPLTASPRSPGGECTLTVKNIRDCARKLNPIAPDTRKTFRYSPLFARWKLDDGKGLAAADVGDNKLDGTLKGGVAWTNVSGRKAVSFDGASGIVDTPTQLEDLAVPFTFTFWVNPAAEQVEYANIFGNHLNYTGLVMQQDRKNTNAFGFGYGDGGKPYGPAGVVQLAANEWQHVAVVCGDGKSFLYLNGVEKSQVSSTGAFTPNLNLSFRLGQGFGEGRFFRGLLSDVRIYRMALSPAEVQAVMKEGGAEKK